MLKITAHCLQLPSPSAGISIVLTCLQRLIQLMNLEVDLLLAINTVPLVEVDEVYMLVVPFLWGPSEGVIYMGLDVQSLVN